MQKKSDSTKIVVSYINFSFGRSFPFVLRWDLSKIWRRPVCCWYPLSVQLSFILFLIVKCCKLKTIKYKHSHRLISYQLHTYEKWVVKIYPTLYAMLFTVSVQRMFVNTFGDVSISNNCMVGKCVLPFCWKTIFNRLRLYAFSKSSTYMTCDVSRKEHISWKDLLRETWEKKLVSQNITCNRQYVRQTYG